MKTRTPTLRLVRMSQLSPEKRREAWRNIKENNHQLAALLSDPQFQSLKDHFDGDVLLKAEDLEAVDGKY
ncbi:hypothetical protein J7438_06965 [Thalassotalea sp. G20_0]|uniref:hypothetical protein n=1 Tax=Thalassotalea sp. G20_0 TaxID=2821093 RepID=UPI001ADC15C5|nr:hypothetical protein [Thalassotalea sp. G20_0]MBO9493825.1 hypothetical protein [Thalassotalea sp. G20_0]